MTNTELQPIPDWQERTALLLGEDKLRKLQNAHILVVGLGGVGAYAVEMLCRAGVGSLTIADGDIIESSNRNRQLPALLSTAGQFKADAIAARLLDINPDLKLTVIREFIRDEKTDALLDAAAYDCVLDAIDTLSPKVNLISKSLEHGFRVVSALGAGGRMDPSQIRTADIGKSYNCKLARALRKRLHKRGIQSGFQVVFSPEDVPEESFVEGENDLGGYRTNLGTISYIPAIFGCFCASSVIKEVIEHGN